MDTKIRALLSIGEKPKDIADRLKIGYHKVLSVQKQLDKDNNNDKTGEAVHMDPVALEIIVEKAKEHAPTNVIKSLERVHEGVVGLQKLDTEFHRVFAKALQKAEGFLDKADLKPSEWVAITNSLSNAYNNIFNNKGVNVSIDNSTSIQSDKLSMFKGSLRG